ncbi:GMC oxidoreductase [Macrolepiota fuliginosa MF-IS2]|uniref:GMC oxidoreductase n=1 Tax=Macrolepiota fuliginosa MF-IS2 TaxID=1400762 RepID=A0A9P6BY85_9AGAR|nr:GMC oxidoreductase [Macrolepiota fuliginosa MF-IS2]
MLDFQSQAAGLATAVMLLFPSLGSFLPMFLERFDVKIHISQSFLRNLSAPSSVGLLPTPIDLGSTVMIHPASDRPIVISNGGFLAALAQDVLRAPDGVGIPFSDDLQDLNTTHASEIWVKCINRHWQAYVMDTQSNLYHLTNARVNRVIFEGNKTVGVAYIPVCNRVHDGWLVWAVVKVRQYIVLSSDFGEGNMELLEELDINASDLLVVGEEYQDRYATLPVYRVSNESQTLDNFLQGVPEVRREADFAPIRWSYKVTREVARRMNVTYHGSSLFAFCGELTSHHPHLHPDSPAACRNINIKTAKELQPDGLTAGIHMGTSSSPACAALRISPVHESIKYSTEDNKAIDGWISDHVGTTWHSLGTCAMNSREQGGVVDACLNIYTPQNPKCGDLSTRPARRPSSLSASVQLTNTFYGNLGMDTYSSALLVGEKGADLVAEDLGLKLDSLMCLYRTLLFSTATQLVR